MQISVKPAEFVQYQQRERLSGLISSRMVVWATVIKDLAIARRYVPNLIAKVVELAIRMLFFVILASIIAVPANGPLGRTMSGHELFIFFQGSLLLFVFKGTALWTPLNAVSRDLTNGTLEFLFSSPSSPYAYYLGTVLSDIIVAQTIFIPLFLTLVVLSGVPLVNMLLVLLVCFVVFFGLLGLGVMIAQLGLLWRQATAVAGIIEISLEMFSGAYFPISMLPRLAQIPTYLLPFTWAYDLIRYYSFDGHWSTLLPVPAEWLLLGVYGVVYVTLSRYLLKKVEAHAKQQGLHLI